MAKKKIASTTLRAPRTPRNPATIEAGSKDGNGDARSKPTHHEIAEAAYHRYLKRQGGQGSDFDDWLAAERELRSDPKSQ